MGPQLPNHFPGLKRWLNSKVSLGKRILKLILSIAKTMPAHPGSPVGFPVQFPRDNGLTTREEVNFRLETELEEQQFASPFIEGPFSLLSVNFTGREAQLDQLGQWSKSHSSQSTVRYLIHGMPGVGKSQLALQFAQNVFETKEYSYVLWISASSEDKLTQGFVSLLDKLGIRDTSASDQSVRVAASRRWLEYSHKGGSDRWLLIFDNVDVKTSQILRSMLPRTHPGGAMLFTARNEDVAFNLSTHRNQRLITLELQPFSEREATEFLSRVTGFSDKRLTDASDAELKDLANTVGRLPLAIDQTAAFMRLGYSVKDMLDLHRSDERLKVSHSPALTPSFVCLGFFLTTDTSPNFQDTRMGEPVLYL
jgi:GTPase SAR1 family protein